MSADHVLDCIVIGYNDPDFRSFAAKQKGMEEHSGAYHEIKTNSFIRNGERISCMDLLNVVLEKATGRASHLNVFEAPSLGVCYLADFLRRRDLEVDFVNFFTLDKDRLRALLAAGPRAVAITTTFYVEDDPIIEIVDFVRRHRPDTKIIVGGPHIFNRAADFDTDTLAFIFRRMGADIYIIDSQGELTLSKVVAALRDGDPARLREIPNIMYALDGEEFCRTEKRPEANDLDAESVHWRDFDPRVVTPLAYLRSARSCPFTCSFCQYPILAGSHDLNSIEVMERQLQELRAMGTTDLVFIDDTFNVPLPRFKKLLQMMIERKFDFRWVSFLRCSNVDEAAMDLMQESGCIGVLLGIESGDQRILNYMNKSVKLERYRFGIRELKKRGIATYASLICGFPGETEQTVRNTMAFIEETGPTFFNVQLYYHDARAPIHRRADEFRIEGAGYSWKHRTMDWRQAIDWSIYMYRNIHNSTFFSLYGMSLWGISYLVSKGLTMEQIRAFGKATRPALFASLADRDMDWADTESWLAEMFRSGTRELQGDAVRAYDEDFWRRQLAGCTYRTPLPGEARAADDPSGHAAEIIMDAALAAGLARLAVANGTVTATVLLGLFKLLLFQLSAVEDMCIGYAVGARILPVRTRLSMDMEFQNLLDAVICSTDAALDHQDHPPDARPNVLYAYQAGEAWRGCAAPELALLVEDEAGGLRLRLERSASTVGEHRPEQYLRSLLVYARTVAFPIPEQPREDAQMVAVG
jgi:radical SAM PhpK family P-methyltransferase